jgi:hypothetical protein
VAPSRPGRRLPSGDCWQCTCNCAPQPPVARRCPVFSTVTATLAFESSTARDVNAIRQETYRYIELNGIASALRSSTPASQSAGWPATRCLPCSNSALAPLSTHRPGDDQVSIHAYARIGLGLPAATAGASPRAAAASVAPVGPAPGRASRPIERNRTALPHSAELHGASSFTGTTIVEDRSCADRPAERQPDAPLFRFTHPERERPSGVGPPTYADAADLAILDTIHAIESPAACSPNPP